MIPALALLGLLQVPIDEPPRLRTILPNGAVVMVERMPREQSISVQLFASSRSLRDTPDSHGMRHLLEHLVAPGRSRDLDRKLETKGMYLRAFTLRDAMRFEVTGSAGQLQDALDALAEMMHPIEATQDEIDRERAIIESEIALQDDAARLGIGAWRQAYGDSGLDPLGSVELLKKATPASLKELQRRQFYPENLVVVITGPVDLDDATKRARALVGQRQGATREAAPSRGEGRPGRVEVAGFGEARGALVPSFQDPTTMATLAVALSVATEFEGSFVTYTPSSQNGLVVVGQTAATGGLGIRLDGLGEGDLSRLYPLGKAMARAWIDRQMGSTTGVAALRGLLLAQGAGYRPETMRENIEGMTLSQFVQAANLLRKERAVVVVGQ